MEWNGMEWRFVRERIASDTPLVTYTHTHTHTYIKLLLRRLLRGSHPLPLWPLPRYPALDMANLARPVTLGDKLETQLSAISQGKEDSPILILRFEDLASGKLELEHAVDMVRETDGMLCCSGRWVLCSPCCRR